jgi:hypothetical protein
MPIFTVHMIHSVESCPIYNDDTKKKLRELSSKREEVALKHQINILTAVFSQLEHLIIYVIEAPNHKAVERYLRDIGFAFYNNIEIREVELMEEALKTL